MRFTRSVEHDVETDVSLWISRTSLFLLSARGCIGQTNTDPLNLDGLPAGEWWEGFRQVERTWDLVTDFGLLSLPTCFFSYFFSLCLLNFCKDLLHVPHIKIMFSLSLRQQNLPHQTYFPRDSRRLPQECWPATWWCHGCWRKRLARAPWRWGSSACAARWDPWDGGDGDHSWYG
jgi:hypothetical protein